jgi:hypothetical protein
MLEMFCAPIFHQYMELLASGASEEELKTVKKMYEACMEQYAPSSAQAVIKQMEMLHDCMRAGGSMWECLGFITAKPPGIKPIPGLSVERTRELQTALFDDTDKVMELSNSLKDAFKRAGIRFEKDETFVCTVAVAKRPSYVSDVVDAGAEPRITSVMEPGIMKQIMGAIERDRIK